MAVGRYIGGVLQAPSRWKRYLGLVVEHTSPRIELWLVLLALCVVNFTWIAFSPQFSADARLLSDVAALLLAFCVLLLVRCARAQTFDWFLDALYRFGLFILFAALMGQLLVFNHLMMSIPFPLADGVLQSWDRALGFDWNAHALWVASDELIRGVVLYAYLAAGHWGVIAIIIVALLYRRHERVDETMYLCLATAVLCILVGVFFPAEAAWETTASPGVKTLLGGETLAGWSTQFHMVRNGDQVHFGTFYPMGLATFPSYHACTAFILMWCSRGHPAGLAVGLVAGLGIHVGTPVFGSHYFVDLLGGAVVTLLLILAWHQPWKRLARPV